MNLLHGLQGSRSHGVPDDLKIGPHVLLTVTRAGADIQRVERTLTDAAVPRVDRVEDLGEGGEAGKFQKGDLVMEIFINNASLMIG